MALVIMLTLLVRRAYGFHDIITAYHINAMGKVMLAGSSMLGYSYVWEAWGPIYGNNIADRTAFLYTVLGTYAPTYWARVTLNVIIPQLLWLPLVRRSEILLFLISLGIIIGMWLERFDIVIPNLARNWMPSWWGAYYPTLWNWVILAGITADVPTTYLTSENTLRSWLLTKDHKRIALLFFGSITFFFFIGGFAATLIRLHLATPEGLLQPDMYNRMFTMHGIIMVWFFLIPSIPTTLGNFVLPLMIGARDLAFPRINLGSWYVFNLSGLVLLYALIMGGVDTGWTSYTPYSTLFANGYAFAAALAVFVNGFRRS
jgi:hypothetical protein